MRYGGYLSTKSLGQRDPDILIAIGPRREVEESILRILGYFLKELAEAVGFRLKLNIFGETCVQIDLVQRLKL